MMLARESIDGSTTSVQTSMSLVDLTRNSFQSGISPTKVFLDSPSRLKTHRRVLVDPTG